MRTFIFTVFISLAGYAANAQTIDSDIQNALAAGNASMLSGYFHSTIELSAGGSEGNYSKSQAQQILLDFFTNNPPSNYESKHSSTGTESRYFIGTLTTSKGNFRVYILLKSIGGTELIQTLRIESQS